MNKLDDTLTPRLRLRTNRSDEQHSRDFLERKEDGKYHPTRHEAETSRLTCSRDFNRLHGTAGMREFHVIQGPGTHDWRDRSNCSFHRPHVLCG